MVSEVVAILQKPRFSPEKFPEIKNGTKTGRKRENQEVCMRRRNIKDRCQKQSLSKCVGVCKTYDAIQTAYVRKLQEREDVSEFRCNVLLEGLTEGEYTSDFVCVKEDGDIMVRECVWRRNLTKPKTAKLLDASRNYWMRRNVTDWGLVIDEEK